MNRLFWQHLLLPCRLSCRRLCDGSYPSLRGIWCPGWRFMYMAGEWVAAAREGGTVDRDWFDNVTNKHRGSKILLVVVDVSLISVNGSLPYVLLSDCVILCPQQCGLRPSITVTTNIPSNPQPMYIISQHYRHERRKRIVTIPCRRVSICCVLHGTRGSGRLSLCLVRYTHSKASLRRRCRRTEMTMT